MEVSERVSTTVLRLGGFHIALHFLSVIGKKFHMSGLEDLLVESSTFAPGSTNALMQGKSYNRGVRAHKLSMETLFRLLWRAFLQWRRSEIQESTNAQTDEDSIILDAVLSFHNAVRDKDSTVQEKADVLGSNMADLMADFELFRCRESSRSDMFAFWNQYIIMVITLFIRAERTGNWNLHLAATSAMTPHFFAHNRPNYSRWLPVYLAGMKQL